MQGVDRLTRNVKERVRAFVQHQSLIPAPDHGLRIHGVGVVVVLRCHAGREYGGHVHNNVIMPDRPGDALKRMARYRDIRSA
jgi:hypothetical protein